MINFPPPMWPLYRLTEDDNTTPAGLFVVRAETMVGQERVCSQHTVSEALLTRDRRTGPLHLAQARARTLESLRKRVEKALGGDIVDEYSRGYRDGIYAASDTPSVRKGRK